MVLALAGAAAVPAAPATQTAEAAVKWWMRPSFHFSVLANLTLLTVLLAALSRPC